jgi:hypothetical protein
MKKIIVFLLFFPCLCFSQEYKISIVNSYGINHIAEKPQLKGIIDTLYNSNKDFIIENYYMDSRINNVTDKQRADVSKIIKNDIYKFNPDFIVTINDIAFKYIGADLSEDYKIIFTGINTPYIEYKNNIKNSKNISGVEEIINLDEFIFLLNKINYIPDTI